MGSGPSCAECSKSGSIPVIEHSKKIKVCEKNVIKKPNSIQEIKIHASAHKGEWINLAVSIPQR